MEAAAKGVIGWGNGMVFRDFQFGGDAKDAAASKLRLDLEVVFAEAMGVKKELKMALDKGFLNLCVEVDSEEVVRAIEGIDLHYSLAIFGSSRH